MNIKKVSLQLLFIFIVFMLILQFGYLGPLQRAAYAETSATIVSSNIIMDTVWTKANSSYILQGDIQIKNRVTLTIEPGVEVKGNGYSIFSYGNIVSVGNEDIPLHLIF